MSKHYIKDIGEVNYIGCVDSVTMGTYDVSELETITKCYSEKFVKDLQQQITDLKSQLAEKEKEIEYQESMKILAVKNQNQKAIEQLEKVKDYFIEGYAVCKNFSDFYWNFTEQIDNQINGLKGDEVV